MNIFFLKGWFELRPLSAGDWSFLYPEAISDFAWPFSPRSGSYPPLDFFFQATTKILNNFGFSWPMIERLVWFWPFLIITFLASWFLAKTLFPQRKLVHWLAPLVYFFNSFILMVVGGGQMGVAMSYALAPLCLSFWVKVINKGKRRNSVKTGVILTVQIMFDPRMAMLTVIAAVIYFLFKHQFCFKRLLKVFFLPSILALGIHLVWLLPLFRRQQSALPAGYASEGWPDFLSFANFSDSFSLLHPNWPENIFGKVYFMRPEFLLIPFLAFMTLFLIKRVKNSHDKKIVLFLCFLAILGSFLAKGTKPPFGGFYQWLFKFFPGMKLFRDPIKFYLLTALAYSLLMPVAVDLLARKLKKFKWAPCLLFLLFWGYTLRPAFSGQLGGTFKAKEIPQEYINLKNLLSNQSEIFQTYWLPKKQRFGFVSQKHAGLEGEILPEKEELQDLSVKYVIIPLDSEKEIFLQDRKYDPQVRRDKEEELDKISWLKKIEGFEKITVYQITADN